uniref:Ribosomal L1 domain-containing protein 1 n=1 Tax=Cajanus cajan TaxID=3821 RepID=A0A151SW68_CAJCA|nr:Ribosomal L1 domain-containing protein 1 [Cajanus cajan]
MASGRVSTETVAKAVDALLKWRRSQSETQKPKLFDEDEEFVYLILTMKRIPSNSRVNPHKVPLPHSLISPFSEQCLILDDRPNKARVTKAQVQAKIQADSIPVAKVLKLSKLASDYRPFEAKRKLCDSYDLFFAEKSIVPLLPRLLGKHFFKKRKIPVPVDLSKKNWKEQVEKACSSAMLFMRTGTCSVVRVAKVRMERDEIVENVVAAVEGVVEVVPKKWANVRSLHLKLLESVALPVYQVVPDVKLKIEGVSVEDEAEVGAKEKKRKKGKDGDVREKKKGRIHEVRYMDDSVDLVVKDEEAGDDSDDEMVDKKTEKGVASDSSGVKRLKKKDSSATKEKKKKGLSGGKGVKEGLAVKDENSGVKKKRGDVEVKAKKSVKVKRSKKAA